MAATPMLEYHCHLHTLHARKSSVAVRQRQGTVCHGSGYKVSRNGQPQEQLGYTTRTGVSRIVKQRWSGSDPSFATDAPLCLLWQDKRWWDYRALFRNRASIYRLVCNLTVSVFGQWTGQAILGLLLSAVLDTAGIHSALAQTNLSLGFSCLQFVMAVSGAFLVDRIGRRPLLLFANVALGLVWFGMAIATSIHFRTGSVDSARAILALIYMFKIVFSLGLTSMVVLYPVEVLSFEMRAKGFAFSGLVVNAAGLLNQFAWPAAFASIRWKTYIILMFWCFFQAVVMYLLIPETRGLTVSLSPTG